MEIKLIKTNINININASMNSNNKLDYSKNNQEKIIENIKFQMEKKVFIKKMNINKVKLIFQWIIMIVIKKLLLQMI